jgi:hypothetical protein
MPNTEDKNSFVQARPLISSGGQKSVKSSDTLWTKSIGRVFVFCYPALSVGSRAQFIGHAMIWLLLLDVDTEEKLEAVLLSAPEPAPEKLEMGLKALDVALPYLRNLFIASAKKLPHARGGAPRKLGTPEEQKTIREEIKALRGPGTKLSDIYTRIAQRYGVSASKIKQIWLDRPK